MNKRQIPNDYKLQKTPEHLKLSLYVSPYKDGFCKAMLFKGKQNKPLWHFRFKSVEKMEQHIDNEIQLKQNSYEYSENYKAEMKAKRERLSKSIKPGDIFNYSWGWEQTNQNFYQVIKKKTPYTLVVREIGCETVEELSWASAHVKPVKDSFFGEEFTVRLNMYGGFKRSCGTANLINENDKFYKSWYA